MGERDAMIEKVARLLAEERGYDPGGLEPGNVVIQTWFDEQAYSNADYDHLFDSGEIPPDGHNGKDPCHFVWRQYIFTAQRIVDLFDAAARKREGE